MISAGSLGIGNIIHKMLGCGSRDPKVRLESMSYAASGDPVMTAE